MNRQSDIGWFELVMGIILLILGVVIMRQPIGVINWIVILCGVLAILTGIVDIVLYVKVEHFTGFGPIVSLVTGILTVMAGFVLIAHPGAGTWALAMILPIWIIAHCISRLSHLQYMKMHFGSTYYNISLVLNILGLAVGILLIFRPMITIFSMGVLIGAYLILEGVECILNGIDGRHYYR